MQVERSSKSDGEIVVIITDVTEHTRQTQQIQQQRNELKLLSAELHSNNQKMAYIIKRFVPEQEAQKLITAHQLPLPGGEGRSQVTIFFADMRNYTGIAEQLLPEEALQMLNEYLNVVAGAVLNQWGNIVQLVGDMVMAFFDASAPGDDHPLRAIRAALEAHASLKHFSAESVAESRVRNLTEKMRWIEKYPLPVMGTPDGFGTKSVTVKMRDGRKWSQEVSVARGMPQNPLSAQEFKAKFKDCAAAHLDDDKAEKCWSLLSELETLVSSPDRKKNFITEILSP